MDMLDLLLALFGIGTAIVAWTIFSEDTRASRRVVQCNYHPETLYPPE